MRRPVSKSDAATSLRPNPSGQSLLAPILPRKKILVDDRLCILLAVLYSMLRIHGCRIRDHVCTSRLVILYFQIPLQLPLDCLSTSCTSISKVVPYRNVLHILMHYSILVSFHPSPLSITPITHRASLPHYCLGGAFTSRHADTAPRSSPFPRDHQCCINTESGCRTVLSLLFSP